MGPNGRLDSWKAIAAYLNRDESTVRRWEKEGLPVHRHVHAKKASIYAYAAEIDTWWSDGRTRLEDTDAPRQSRRRLAWLLAGASLLLAGGAAWFFHGKRTEPVVQERITSIAVLPLANLSGDPQQDYFADGITEALITELGKIGSLRVVSRASVAPYKGGKLSLDKVARDLNVESLVEGSVVREGSRVRVIAHLIRTRPERQLWAQRYEREVSSILVLQKDLALAIAGEIQAKLTPREDALLAQVSSVDPAAYEAYLNGRYHWNTGSAQGLLKARESFQDAIRRDPTFARAHASLADTYAWSYRWNVKPLMSPRETFAEARSAALKALELDDTLAEAHATLAYIKEAYDWDWPGAEHHYRRAIELNPSYATAYHWFAIELSAMGRHAEAAAQIKAAERLDPRSAIIKAAAGMLLFYAREYEAALDKTRQALDLDPGLIPAHRVSRWIYQTIGRYEEALAAYQNEKSFSGAANEEWPVPLAQIQASGGRLAEAQAAIKRGVQSPLVKRNPEVLSLGIAQAYALMGERDQALSWLAKAEAARAPGFAFVLVDPLLDNLRADPRFVGLLKKAKLQN